MTEECSNVLPPLVVALDDILHLGGTKRGLLEKQNSDHDRWGFTGVIRLHLCHLKQNGSRVLGYSGWCHHFEYVIMLWKEPALIRILSFYFEHKNNFLELVANRSLYNLLLNNIMSPVDPEGGRCHPHQIPDHTPTVGNESIANKWLHVKGALKFFFLSTSGMKKKKNDRGIFSASGCLFYCIAQVTHRYITLYRLCEGRRPKQSRQLDSRSGNMATTPEKTNVRGGIKKWQNTENVGAFPNWAANTSDASLLEHGPCMSTVRLSILQHLCQTHTHTHIECSERSETR